MPRSQITSCCGSSAVRQPAVHVGQRHHRAHRAGTADHDVGVGQRGGQIVEREGVGRDAELADVLGEPLRARQRPVHDVDAADARPHQVRGRQRAHRARRRPRPRCGRPAEPSLASAMSSATDTTEAPAASIPVSECTRLPTDSARWASSCRVRPTVWLASAAAYARRTWPEHLLLADHRGIQAAGHREQVLDGGLGVAHVGVLGQIAQRHAGVLGEHLPDHRQAAVEGLDHRVDLDAVAGGQHHGLGHQRRLQHLVDDLGLIGLVGAQLLQDGHRRAAVRNPEKQDAHGFITTSSKVVVYQLAYQICSTSCYRTPLARSARNRGSSTSQ